MGRGRHYDRWRRWSDIIQRAAYGSGWAARIAYSMGLQSRLHVDRRTFRFGESAGRTPLRVAFASDLHAGPLTDPRRLEAAVHRIAEWAPDLLLLGGDYVSVRHGDVGSLAKLLAGLNPTLGIFGVLGNHDLWQDDLAITRALTEVGVRLLINEELRLPAPYAHIGLYGMDEPGTGNPEGPSAVLRGDDVRIVLMHSPFGLRYLQGIPFHLALCGHTHGGQIATPSGAPIVLPPGSGDRQQARGGVFAVQGGQILVSRGVGMSSVPIRIFAPPEVHLCTIE